MFQQLPQAQRYEYRIMHLITIMPVSQLHFLANKKAELAGGSQ